jgi:hypothetical protein
MSKEQNFDNSKKALHIAVVSKCLPIKQDIYRDWFHKNFCMSSDTSAEFTDEIESGKEYLNDDIYEVYSELKENER